MSAPSRRRPALDSVFLDRDTGVGNQYGCAAWIRYGASMERPWRRGGNSRTERPAAGNYSQRKYPRSHLI